MGGQHIVVVNNCGYGHVLPTLDTVAELVRRGHRVSYVTSGGPVARVEATGATVLTYPSRLAEVDLATLDTAEEGIWLLVTHLQESERILDAVTAPLLADPPDVVVYDVTVYHAGRILAGRFGVPAVVSSAVFLSNEHFSFTDLLVALGPGRRPRRRHPALVEFHHRLHALLTAHGQSHRAVEQFLGQQEPLHLAYHPRSFQYAGETFDERYVFVGPSAPAAAERAGWSPPADGRPVLLVSLGTSGHRRPGFYRVCLAAFADLPWQVVLVTPEGVDPDELAAPPPNVELHRWLPLAAVLAHALVFLCHGGMGSVMAAMAAGTPVVAIPTSLEATANARRVAELGLGRLLAADGLTAGQLCATVREVAADAGIRARVAAMRADLCVAGGGRLGADAIEAQLSEAHLP